jgi:hypothetical protein
MANSEPFSALLACGDMETSNKVQGRGNYE